jgi:hypothetical protein
LHAWTLLAPLHAHNHHLSSTVSLALVEITPPLYMQSSQHTKYQTPFFTCTCIGVADSPLQRRAVAGGVGTPVRSAYPPAAPTALHISAPRPGGSGRQAGTPSNQQLHMTCPAASHLTRSVDGHDQAVATDTTQSMPSSRAPIGGGAPPPPTNKLPLQPLSILHVLQNACMQGV